MAATLDLPRRLAYSYSALARGLLAPSDSDYPYTPFSAAFDADQELTPETFRAALHLANFWKIHPSHGDQNGDDYFAETVNYRPEEAPIYEHLQRAMKATLNGPLENWVVTAWPYDEYGFRYSRRYVFGRVQNGGLAGLQALIVWA